MTASGYTRDEVVAMYRDRGMSLREIGAELGISKQAVSRRLDRAGVDRVPSALSKRARYDTWVRHLPPDVDELLDGTRSLSELAVRFNGPRAWVRRYLLERFGSLHLAATGGGLARRFDDDTIVAVLQRVARECAADGVGAAPVSMTDYVVRRREGDPQLATVLQRYANWSSACKCAGIPHRDPGRAYTLRWTSEAVVEALAEYVDACRATGVRPVLAHYNDVWRLAHVAPSVATVRIRCGSWRAALVMASQRELRATKGAQGEEGSGT